MSEEPGIPTEDTPASSAGPSRRTVLIAAGVALALGAGGIGVLVRRASTPEGGGVAPPALVRIGERYLAEHEPVTVEDLERELLPSGTGSPTDLLDDDGLREGLRTRVRDDGATGRVVEVGGWVLSETSARYCALLALTGASSES